jgi:hypothetical protein
VIDAKPSPRIRARTRAHRCFELSGRGALNDPSWTLVHGSIYGPNNIAHAWLTKDGVVYDTVIDRYMTEIEYAEKFNAVSERSYELKEATPLLLKQGHWGPWHDTLSIVRRP